MTCLSITLVKSFITQGPAGVKICGINTLGIKILGIKTLGIKTLRICG